MWLVAGEALYDVFVAEDKGPAGFMLDARPGGSPFNVAIGIARLGGRCAFFGGMSQAFLGQRLQEILSEEGVATDLLTLSNTPTTLALVGLAADGSASYSFNGQGAADRLVPREAIERLPGDAHGVHVGSYCLVVEPIATTLAALLDRLPASTMVALDPNIRPTVEPDMAIWRARVEAAATRANLIKVSIEDLALLYPDTCADDIAQRWLAGPATAAVFVTQGDAGATRYTTGQRQHIAPPQVAVVDTVGAGDSFQAALLAGIQAMGVTTADALHGLDDAAWHWLHAIATEASARTVARRGADLPRQGDVAAFATPPG